MTSQNNDLLCQMYDLISPNNYLVSQIKDFLSQNNELVSKIMTQYLNIRTKFLKLMT